jgi:6-methylsalicylate decarboxylase
MTAETIRSHPARFGGFACLPLPDVDGALAEIDYALGTLGLDGVMLLTNANGTYLGDSRLDPVFDELNRRAAVVFLHPALPACADCTSLGYAPLIDFVFDTTRAVTHLVLSGTLERSPDLRVIVPHAGGTIPYLADRIDLLASRFVPGASQRAPAGVKAYLRRLYNLARHPLKTMHRPVPQASPLHRRVVIESSGRGLIGPVIAGWARRISACGGYGTRR